jgi:hypothetical protein
MGPKQTCRPVGSMSPLPLPAQPVDATQALNLSAGVSNCKVSRGRSLADEPLCSVDHLIGVREHAGRYKAASPARHEIDCKPGSTAAGLTRSERHAATSLQNSIRGALDSRP